MKYINRINIRMYYITYSTVTLTYNALPFLQCMTNNVYYTNINKVLKQCSIFT